jgi:hypothetical protein
MAYNITTAKKLAQRVIRIMSQGDKTRDYSFDEREVIEVIVDVANRLLKLEYYQTKDQEITKAVSSHFIQTYNGVDVKINTVTGQNYIDLPAPYINLPYNMGVQRIAPLTDSPAQNKAMIVVQANEMDILGDILGSMQKQWVYEVQGTKAFFHKRCGKTLCDADIKKVSVTLVVSIPDLAPDTPFPAPPDTHEQIITESIQLLSVVQYKDKINDDNPNTVASNEQ